MGFSHWARSGVEYPRETMRARIWWIMALSSEVVLGLTYGSSDSWRWDFGWQSNKCRWASTCGRGCQLTSPIRCVSGSRWDCRGTLGSWCLTLSPIDRRSCNCYRMPSVARTVVGTVGKLPKDADKCRSFFLKLGCQMLNWDSKTFVSSLFVEANS